MASARRRRYAGRIRSVDIPADDTDWQSRRCDAVGETPTLRRA
ncbi:MAG: hypothetical protein ABDI19_02190 [Armatimonadota bacterium]